MQFKEFQTEQKLRGGYYTPLDIAAFISKWVVAKNGKARILEPSCGDGIFFDAISKTCKHKVEIDAFEIEADEACKAKRRASLLGNLISARVQNCDFLDWLLRSSDESTLYDGVVGNPPFIRYQYLPQGSQVLAEKIFNRYRLHFTRHTNAWVPFVVASIGLLRPGGRFGMVVPSEVLHVMHAQSLRNFLGLNCRRILIFDPEDLWFEKTLQGAVILLAEKKKAPGEKTRGLGIIRTAGRDFLNKSPSRFFNSARYVNGKTLQGKWMRALLSEEELSILEGLSEHERVFSFGEIAKVDVGLVTGANKFFLVTDSVVESYELEKWAHPMFGRSEHCPGVIYDRRQHKNNSKKGLPSNFIWFNVKSEKELSNKARRYIKEGEKQDLHKRYKCRIREPWFKVPSVYASEIGLLKRAHDIPRLLYNKLKAYTTDTAYRITASQIRPERLVSFFLNSLTALSAEIEGRHYGGGVLELVPSEIEKLVVPVPQNTLIQLKGLDESIRTRPVEEVLDKQDQVIFRDGMGLSQQDQLRIREGWNRLRKRRQRIPAELDN